MFWFQTGLSFVLWIAVGVVVSRPMIGLDRQIFVLSRGTRIGVAAVTMVSCLAFLFLPLNFISTRGQLNGGPMSLLSWGIVTLSGLFFVASNTTAMKLLASVVKEAAVTERTLQTSTTQDSIHE